MKFLTNTYDPELPDAIFSVAWDYSYETQAEAWNRHLVWLSDKVIGRPQATNTYTVEELEAMNMVGVYSLED